MLLRIRRRHKPPCLCTSVVSGHGHLLSCLRKGTRCAIAKLLNLEEVAGDELPQEGDIGAETVQLGPLRLRVFVTL
jgi:hypothetical protein